MEVVFYKKQFLFAWSFPLLVGISTEPSESCRVKIDEDAGMGNIVQAPSIN